jgi:glycosyltransferase involved in cell wall biosynthesis
MLSILIPAYNYNAFPLVLELHKQCMECNLEFEIICQDDASCEFKAENNQINILENCSFSSNESNLGRGRNINKMASKATYTWLLILDCDTFPQNFDFIKKYLFEIQKNENEIVFGGILYKEDKPEKEQLLRWFYGHKRESIFIEKRKEKSNIRALTSNLLIKKEIFSKHPFDESITKYGYEDLCFMTTLKTNKIEVTHIENPTFHLNLETSEMFLKKTKIALENLLLLYHSNKITPEASKLITYSNLLKKLRLTQLTAFLFQKNKTTIEANLLSQKPSLFLFDLYKLGYFCSLKGSN